MDNIVKYKDTFFYRGFLLEPIHPKLFKLFDIKIEEGETIYRLSVAVDTGETNGSSLDIYLSPVDKKLLIGTISNVLHGNCGDIELNFANKLHFYNKGYYKLTQFINFEFSENTTVTMNMKLKIYRDKNFVLIKPEVSYSCIPIKIYEIEDQIYQILLSEESIEEIKLNCES